MSEIKNKPTPSMIKAGVDFFREFMGDEYPATMLDAKTLVAGVWAAMSDQRGRVSDKTPSDRAAQP